jgi:hypothetical protein
MAGLVPAIHDFLVFVDSFVFQRPVMPARQKSVDGRHKAGHDDRGIERAARHDRTAGRGFDSPNRQVFGTESSGERLR